MRKNLYIIEFNSYYRKILFVRFGNGNLFSLTPGQRGYRIRPKETQMNELVLLGDEAVALGALHAGLSAAYGYPGTPSTEIIEYLKRVLGSSARPVVSWCANEKTAYEGALGTSFVGRRALVTMKHVGLNVASDPFVNSALVQLGGGLVVAVADHPGMHSSQDEQDSRFYADFARVPCFEPADHQEAYRMTREAFDLSERLHVPVVLKMVTRLAHSRGIVKPEEPRGENPVERITETNRWILTPANARVNWERLLDLQKTIIDYTAGSEFNSLELSPDVTEYGVITTGLGRNYYLENLPDLPRKPSLLHIGVYPVPDRLIKELFSRVKGVYIFEEGYPFIERRLAGVFGTPVPVWGKLSGHVPRSGELTPDAVRKALGLPERKTKQGPPIALPGRPPQLCKGCPHGDTFLAMKEALSGFTERIVTSDIGCYALGAMPPYRIPETVVCMGASIGMAKGASEAGFYPVLATIGDSTFFHSGVTPLIDAVSADTDMTVVIMDNGAVAMTGGQETVLPVGSIENLVMGLGVPREHVRVLTPLPKHFAENVAAFREEIAHHGLSVIIMRRECLETLKRKKKGEKE